MCQIRKKLLCLQLRLTQPSRSCLQPTPSLTQQGLCPTLGFCPVALCTMHYALRNSLSTMHCCTVQFTMRHALLHYCAIHCPHAHKVQPLCRGHYIAMLQNTYYFNTYVLLWLPRKDNHCKCNLLSSVIRAKCEMFVCWLLCLCLACQAQCGTRCIIVWWVHNSVLVGV